MDKRKNIGILLKVLKIVIKTFHNLKLIIIGDGPEKNHIYGIVLAEALALSVSVISTNCGNPAEIIDDGKTGYLVNIGDYQDITKK